MEEVQESHCPSWERYFQVQYVSTCPRNRLLVSRQVANFKHGSSRIHGTILWCYQWETLWSIWGKMSPPGLQVDSPAHPADKKIDGDYHKTVDHWDVFSFSLLGESCFDICRSCNSYGDVKENRCNSQR